MKFYYCVGKTWVPHLAKEVEAPELDKYVMAEEAADDYMNTVGDKAKFPLIVLISTERHKGGFIGRFIVEKQCHIELFARAV